GCNNMMSPPKANKNLSNGLQISVSGGDTGKRTLFPDAKFVEYELTFDYQDASETYAPVTLPGTAPSTLVTGLADGDWTITAVGKVEIDGVQYAAAEGSETITVSSSSFQSLAIDISPNQTGPDGVFTYSVNFPDNVDLADLFLEEYSGGWSNHYDLLTASQDSILVPPGYYIMSIYMETENDWKGRSEVVHIYSNMETRAVYEITEDDFTKFITLSGTVAYSGNANDLDAMTIDLYLDEDFTDYAGYYFNVDLSDNTWSLKAPALDQSLTLYLRAYGQDEYYNWFDVKAGSITVKNEDISDFKININLSMVTLSGTVDTLKTFNWLYVVLYSDEDCANFLTSTWADISNGNEWSMSISAYDADTTLYFRVEGYDGSYSYNNEAGSIVVKNTDIDNITLSTNFYYVTLSGTLNVTGDYDYAEIEYYDYWNGWFGGSYNSFDGSWSIDVPAQNKLTNLDLIFYIEIGDSGCYAPQTVPVYDANISGIVFDIDLNQFITLSGTVNYNAPTDYMSIDIYTDEDLNDWIGWTDVNISDNNMWSIKLPKFAQNTTLYFEIYHSYGSQGFSLNANSTEVWNVDKTGIEILPNGFSAGTITLSGTIDTAKSVNAVFIYADTYDDEWRGVVNLLDSTWTMEIPKFSGKKAIEFTVSYDDGSWWHWDSTYKRIIVAGNDVSDIVLRF
ncbi:MAG: hypothetical protein FWH41_04810, partial [Treponema sp.]|nr:hypothetical protein [Treponema sp.]